jgi:hypothetical protein
MIEKLLEGKLGEKKKTLLATGEQYCFNTKPP